MAFLFRDWFLRFLAMYSSFMSELADLRLSLTQSGLVLTTQLGDQTSALNAHFPLDG